MLHWLLTSWSFPQSALSTGQGYWGRQIRRDFCLKYPADFRPAHREHHETQEHEHFLFDRNIFSRNTIRPSESPKHSKKQAGKLAFIINTVSLTRATWFSRWRFHRMVSSAPPHVRDSHCFFAAKKSVLALWHLNVSVQPKVDSARWFSINFWFSRNMLARSMRMPCLWKIFSSCSVNEISV